MSTWVLLRGLTREQRHWGGFPQLLAQHLPGARIVALDLPGNGRLHEQPSPLTVEAMADHCRAELRRLGLPPPYHVLAMSLGAMVAASWASRHPEDLAACVLINTSMRPFSPFYQRLRPRAYATILRLMLRGGTPEDWEEAVLRLTSHQAPEAVRHVLKNWVVWRADAPVSRANALRQLWAAARFRANDAAPRTPLLVLMSEQDGLVNPLCSKALAKHWGADIQAHPKAGHDIPLDDGAWVARQVSQRFGEPS